MTAAPHNGQIVESPTPNLVLKWHDEDDTAAFAARLSRQPELANAFVTLHGDLGAGKTTLVRHLLRTLGVEGRIKSPTYAVVEPHDAPSLQPTGKVWHFDFYRFDDPREWEDAGFRDIFATPGLKLAEWPEKAATLTPPADLAIHIEAIDDTERTVTLRAGTPAGHRMLQGISA